MAIRRRVWNRQYFTTARPIRNRLLCRWHRPGPSHLYSVSWNGQKTRQLTADARADSDVCVAPSGKFLVFVRQQGNNVHIWRANVDGTGQHQLTFGPECETEPSISPHGDWIAYTVSDPVPGSTYALSVMWTNGTHRQILTPRSTAKQDTTPTFDRAGTKVYFNRFWLKDSGPLSPEVWAVNISGNEVLEAGPPEVVVGPSLRENPALDGHPRCPRSRRSSIKVSPYCQPA